ncbi:Hypothetical predicted protein, partial [Pelobates cultripes]
MEELTTTTSRQDRALQEQVRALEDLNNRSRRNNIRIGANQPRNAIICMHYFHVKETLKRATPLQIECHQDLAPSTLQKRRVLHP